MRPVLILVARASLLCAPNYAGFTYHDGTEKRSIARDSLLEALSTGEKKALYVLNIMFEVETRVKENRETLIVVDDIADSFDYQNKYAIIEYLKDIGQDPLFKQIIMTHNFDFFRTLESRLVNYKNCFVATKSSKGISLKQASGIRNISINDLKKHFFTDPKKKIASIPLA
jgi:wobble nucleotide-excising tRNase